MKSYENGKNPYDLKTPRRSNRSGACDYNKLNETVISDTGSPKIVYLDKNFNDISGQDIDDEVNLNESFNIDKNWINV